MTIGKKRAQRVTYVAVWGRLIALGKTVVRDRLECLGCSVDPPRSLINGRLHMQTPAGRSLEIFVSTQRVGGYVFWTKGRFQRESDRFAAIVLLASLRLATMSLHLFAGMRVRDFEAARPWYERLLGEPTFFPHATEAVWTLAEDRSVYVVEDADGAGNSVVTIFLDDLDAYMAAIAARGLKPHECETYSNGVRKALYRDPDGNELGFGGAPLETRSRA